MLRIGTTSACAENTDVRHQVGGVLWNYLRVRGEYQIKGLSGVWIEELPPRARRIPDGGDSQPGRFGTTSACAENTYVMMTPLSFFGTTSACAENTCSTMCPQRWKRNYLRVRGEYLALIINVTINKELPPRARRILGGRGLDQGDCGTTSACAENTGLRLGVGVW